MKHGRELDAEIAERIFGLYVSWEGGAPFIYRFIHDAKPGEIATATRAEQVANYCTDNKAADEVLRKIGATMSIRGTTWILSLPGRADPIVVREADGWAHAACIGALLSKGTGGWIGLTDKTGPAE